MRKEEKCLAKGIYSHPQVSGYLSVKQFMIIEQDGKKCLLLRFANEASFQISQVEFVLRQLNSKGDEISASVMKYSDLRIKVGGMYALEKGIVLKQECVDVVVQMISLVGGRYKYKFKNGIVTAHYDKDGYGVRETHNTWHRSNSVEVSSRYSDGGQSHRGVAFLSLVLIIVSLVLVIFGNVYYEEMQLRYYEMQYEEQANESREEPVIEMPTEAITEKQTEMPVVTPEHNYGGFEKIYPQQQTKN